MRCILAGSLMLAGLIPSGRAALAACPSDTLIVCGSLTTSTAPSQSALGSGFCTAGASYDLSVGQLTAGSSGLATEAEVTTEDFYTIAGPASVDPVALTARFVVQVRLAYLASARGFITGPGGTQGFSTGICICYPLASFTEALSLPLAYAVGEPFHLILNLEGKCPNVRGYTTYASVTGLLSFEIPPGYSVFSCQGYGTPVTGTRSRSWGQLKTLYR